MHNKVIISDTSILIALDKIKKLFLLEKLYGEIIITPEVKEEFGEILPDWIKIKEVTDKDKVRLTIRIRTRLRRIKCHCFGIRTS